MLRLIFASDCPLWRSVRRALAAEGLREMPFNFDADGAKVIVNF